MPKISVICVTNRQGWSAIFQENLERQTFRDFEVIVAADVPAEQALGSFVPRKKEDGDAWNLNRAYNDCLDRAQGELLVFLQDFIWIPANGLERFWEIYQLFPEKLITGVGHKAQDGLEGISEVDNRVFGEDELAAGSFSHWELNWAACPRALMPRFNEKMDKFYGGENQYIAKKSGLGIIIDRQNQCIGFSQEECGGRPENWETQHSNKGNRLTSFLENC